MRIPFSRPLQVKRQTGAYVNGRWQNNAPETIDILGSSQPFTAREMLMMPEGSRSKERIKIYTTTEILARTPTHAADRIVVRGIEWEVESVEDFTMPGSLIKHYKVIAVNPGQAESA